MKVYRYVVLMCCFIILLTGCSFVNLGSKDLMQEISDENQYADTELYKMGLDLISIMNEMIQSKEYADILNANGLESVVETVDTNDYDSPIAVYNVSLPETTQLLKLISNYNTDSWDNLSENLKNQIKNKTSFSTVTANINAQKGAENVAFSSMYTAFVKSEVLNIKESTVFLYVFEEGVPIAITFSEYGNIQGQFVFLENIDTLSDARSVLEKYNCSVSEIDID